MKSLPEYLDKSWEAEEFWNLSAIKEETTGESMDPQFYLSFWFGPYFRDL